MNAVRHISIRFLLCIRVLVARRMCWRIRDHCSPNLTRRDRDSGCSSPNFSSTAIDRPRRGGFSEFLGTIRLHMEVPWPSNTGFRIKNLFKFSAPLCVEMRPAMPGHGSIGPYYSRWSPSLCCFGKTGTSAGVAIASVAIRFLVGTVTIPYLDIMGASLVRGVSLIVKLCLSIPFLRRILRLSFDTSAYRSVWVASPPMAVAVLLAQELVYSGYLLSAWQSVGCSSFCFFGRFNPLTGRTLRFCRTFSARGWRSFSNGNESHTLTDPTCSMTRAATTGGSV